MTCSFTGCLGYAVYEDITYGAHIKGDYRFNQNEEVADFTTLFQLTDETVNPIHATVASEQGRFSGRGKLIGEFLVTEGNGTPLFRVGQGFFTPADVPLSGMTAIYPMRYDLWMFVTYLAYSDGKEFKLVRNVIWHERRDKEEASPPTKEEARPLTNESVARPANPLNDLEELHASLCHELDEKREELEEATDTKEILESECESVEEEVLELEFEQCGFHSVVEPASGSKECDLVGRRLEAVNQIRNGYLTTLDLTVQIAEATRDCESLSDEVDELEDEISEVEEKLDNGYSTWVDEQVHKAEVLTSKPTEQPAADVCWLIPSEAESYLSDDASRFIATFHKLSQLYSKEADLQKMDWGPLIGIMSKACERILSDYLGPRCTK